MFVYFVFLMASPRNMKIYFSLRSEFKLKIQLRLITWKSFNDGEIVFSIQFWPQLLHRKFIVTPFRGWKILLSESSSSKLFQQCYQLFLWLFTPESECLIPPIVEKISTKLLHAMPTNQNRFCCCRIGCCRNTIHAVFFNFLPLN